MAIRPSRATLPGDNGAPTPFWQHRSFYLAVRWLGAAFGIWWFGALTYPGLPVIFEMLAIASLVILAASPMLHLKRAPTRHARGIAPQDMPGILFVMILFIPPLLILISAPCRALILWLADPLPQRLDGWSANTLSLAGTEFPIGLDVMLKQMLSAGWLPTQLLRTAHLDLFAGAVATLAGLALLFTLGNWQLRMARQLRNIPTSTARSAAIGLAEFRGVARGTNPILRLRSDDGEDVVHLVTSFMLEDVTGSIRIEPGEAVIRSYWSAQFMQRIAAQIVLTRHVQVRTFGRPEIRELRDGDPVYVLGNVEPIGEGTDSGRLVVRRNRRRVPMPWLYRLLRANRSPELFADIDVFFIADIPEMSARKWLIADFRKTLMIGLCFVCPSVWLFWHGGRGLGMW